MKSATLITSLGAILALGTQAAMATCYGSGPEWPDKSQALGFIRDACSKTNGMFTGGFNPLQTKWMCPHSKDIGLLFEIQNLNNVGTYNLDDNECITRLSNEINGCSHGGESSISGWRFR
ncbi:hypothetical protein LQW54_000039 [Pestalotiopsis sp. IQ-011]